MKSFTITSDDPDFWATLEFLKHRRSAGAEVKTNESIDQKPISAETTEAMVALAEVEALLERIGTGSKSFLKNVANHCQEAGSQTFTMRDIAGRMGVTEKHVRANQRNVMKSAGALGVKLWDKKWDFNNRHQVFTISQCDLNALNTLL